MLREISSTRQNPDEPRKRWFSSASMDLVAWFDDDDVLARLDAGEAIDRDDL